LSCSALREPSAAKRPVPSPRLVSLRHSGSPAVCLRGSGNLRLPKAYVFGHALFPFAAQGAGTLRLRLRACLPSLAAEPLRVSLLVAGPATAVPALCRRDAAGGSPWRRGALRSPRAFFLSFPYPPTRAQAPAGIRGVPYRLRLPCLQSLGIRLPSSCPHLSFPRKRESRESDLPPPLLFHNTVSPSTFTIAEQCHSDGVLPSVSKAKRRGISSRIGQ